MVRETFREKTFSKESAERVRLCNEIVAIYMGQGLRLTLRQLYYQLVTRNAITNEEKSYKKLSKLVSDARLAGLVDWDAIEDRVRVPQMAGEWDDLGDLVDAALNSYRLPRWKDQPSYAELWVEKDALAGVLAPIARQWHVTLMVNRGYSSQSAMYESANRFSARGDGKDLVLFYLGDHDPSGEDMVRDVRDRLSMFGADVDVRKLALTMEQIEEHDPPPNPAKITDPRAGAYIAEHGSSSWEVDALPPELLRDLINAAFEEIVDADAMDAVKEREEKDKRDLTKAVESIQRKGKRRR